MGDYGRALEFGINVDPTAAAAAETRELVGRADAAGLDLVAIQDHPYIDRFFDTWALMATILAETERIRVFPDVANLPLRPPAMLAKAGASLDVLSGGRFELGIGAGSSWDAIAAMGGPRRTARESVEALEEAIAVIRLFWTGERGARFEGRFYTVKGLHPGPPPAHPIAIWIGAYRPRMLNLTGRLGDGWIPSLRYAPPDRIPALQRRVDDGAEEAGRRPVEIRRMYNVSGAITAGTSRGLLQGPVSQWIDELTGFILDLGLDTFLFWPREDHARQVDLFAGDVVPRVREAVAAARGS
jgi:alkanesulfonate monooxygenase SsuD/methylene tetrahydromethanopterin reductase-like flavin-dependent oxidoreductase (luciferase family)